MNYAKRFLEYLFPNTAYYVPAAILLLVIFVLAGAAIRTRSKSYRANCVLGIVISALLLMVIAVDMRYRWQWIVGFLPMLMVGYQLFFLWLHHPKEIDRRDGARFSPTERQQSLKGAQNHSKEIDDSDGPGFSPAEKEESLKRAQKTISGHFGLKTLFVRYGLPAVLLGITGIIVLDILVEPGKFFSLLRVINEQIVPDDNVTKILLGVRLGAVGAYYTFC